MRKQVNQSYNNISGTCLSFSMDIGTTGCTCSTQSGRNCTGVFITGVTCGPALSLKGACCLHDRENNTVIPCQPTTFCECFTLAHSFDFTYKWTPFTSVKSSCKDFTCGGMVSGKGACCDGNGGCEEVLETACKKENRFFQGAGTYCLAKGDNICVSGTGGCCQPGITCNDGVTGTTCLSENKIYFGNSKKCFEFANDSVQLPCYSIIPGYKLKVGDVIEDSIVVGIYSPNTSQCLGNPIFKGTSEFAALVNGSEVSGTTYTSTYDYNGYGVVITDDVCNSEDTFIMLLSLHPLSYNTSTTFTWSNGGFAFGPLLDAGGAIIETQTQSINTIKEGYIINTGLTLSINQKMIVDRSYPQCKVKRSFGDTAITRCFRNNEHNFNGRWSSGWGLYNTIRMSNAELMYNSGITFDSYMYSSLYAPSSGFTEDMVSAVKAIQNINRKTRNTVKNISSWYIPSINELAFLANQCVFNNLNSAILNANGTPILGELWSSTGTFNYTSATGGEGIYNGATANAGSYAWSMDINSNGCTVKKDSRLINKQVRAIRVIRCDGNYMRNTKDNAVWKVNY